MTFYFVTLYSGLPRKSGWSETPDDHVDACYKLNEHWALSIMPKIPEMSVGIQMERFVSVSSDRNIRDHLWRLSTYFDRNIPTEIRRSIFDKQVLCPY